MNWFIKSSYFHTSMTASLLTYLSRSNEKKVPKKQQEQTLKSWTGTGFGLLNDYFWLTWKILEWLNISTCPMMIVIIVVIFKYLNSWQIFRDQNYLCYSLILPAMSLFICFSLESTPSSAWVLFLVQCSRVTPSSLVMGDPRGTTDRAQPPIFQAPAHYIFSKADFFHYSSLTHPSHLSLSRIFMFKC